LYCHENPTQTRIPTFFQTESGFLKSRSNLSLSPPDSYSVTCSVCQPTAGKRTRKKLRKQNRKGGREIGRRQLTPFTGLAPNVSGKTPSLRRMLWQFGARWMAAPVSRASRDRSNSYTCVSQCLCPADSTWGTHSDVVALLAQAQRSCQAANA